MKRKKKTKGLSTVFLVVLFFAGLSLLLYPTVSNFLNTRNHSQTIASYAQNVNNLNEEKYAQIREDAINYNEALLSRANQYALSEDLLVRYDELLDLSGTGVMGYVEIPCIDCTLPIYHGTDESVLQVAAGHLEWTSLPIGGESTHSVISGHRGLPSAELLTHIDRLEIGNVFYIHVLDEVLKYRVDDIAVVEPEDTSRLRIVDGQDYVTLVTCTPYGINSHRLLVRGTRVMDGAPISGNSFYINNEVREVPLIYVIPASLVILIMIIGILVLGYTYLCDKFRNLL